MELTFRIKYTHGLRKFDNLDSYYGSESLLGITRFLLISMNAYANRDIITQATSAKGFRLVFGTSKKGSWEQLIHFIVTSQEVADLLKDLGKNGLYDLLKFSFFSLVGVPYVLKNRKAKKVIADLRKENDDLQEKLDDALMRAHAPIKHQGLTVRIKADQTEIITLDHETLSYLETEIVEEEVLSIDMCVSRFNARTGTGRFISSMDSASFPFVPEVRLSIKRKTILAENLALLTRGAFFPITVHVSRVTSQDGRLKSYRLHGVETPV